MKLGAQTFLGKHAGCLEACAENWTRPMRSPNKGNADNKAQKTETAMSDLGERTKHLGEELVRGGGSWDRFWESSTKVWTDESTAKEQFDTRKEATSTSLN